eukprot:7538633-Ditylum_brightwellii.AAC.1
MALDLELQDNNSHFVGCVDCDRDFIFFQHSQNQRACLILFRPSEKWEGCGVISDVEKLNSLYDLGAVSYK